MKNLWLVFGVLLWVPFLAQDVMAQNKQDGGAVSYSAGNLVYGDSALEIPPQVYTAFVEMPPLEARYQQLRAREYTLLPEDMKRLKSYRQTLKGLIMVEVGYLGCPPCRQLFAGLLEENNGEPSLLQKWQNKGGRFYQLDWQKDHNKNSDKKISTLWEIKMVPVLLFFKDGVLVARLNGMNVKNPSMTMSEIGAQIDNLNP